MSWLRLDDGFADHPKLLGLTPAQRWTWLELLLYCARHRTGGVVPTSISQRVPGASPAFVRRALELELLERYVTDDVTDDVTDELRVHDWQDYNGPLEATARRQKRYRMRRAGVPEAEVLKEAPLALEDDIPFERYVTRDVPRDVTGDVTRDVADDASTHARDPHPHKDSSTPTSTVGGEGLAIGIEFALTQLLELLPGASDSQRDYIRGAARRLPEARTAGLLELLRSGTVRDRLGYTLTTYRNALEELEA